MSKALLDRTIAPKHLELIGNELEKVGPEETLRWATNVFGPDAALATGFGAEGCVLIAMLSHINPQARVFYLDTDLLFPETYALRDELSARYGVKFERRATNLSVTHQAFLYGEKLWEREPDQCCKLRKVGPLKEMLSDLRAWITGIRRDQSPTRAAARVVDWDSQFNLIKINPLASWNTSDVWNYITKHNVPYNPLHNSGYPSIGCIPCTTPIQIGESTRAGRWRNNNKTECGLHQTIQNLPATEGTTAT